MILRRRCRHPARRCCLPRRRLACHCRRRGAASPVEGSPPPLKQKKKNIPLCPPLLILVVYHLGASTTNREKALRACSPNGVRLPRAPRDLSTPSVACASRASTVQPRRHHHAHTRTCRPSPGVKQHRVLLCRAVLRAAHTCHDRTTVYTCLLTTVALRSLSLCSAQTPRDPPCICRGDAAIQLAVSTSSTVALGAGVVPRLDEGR